MVAQEPGSPFQIRWIRPAPDLADYVNSVFVLSSDEGLRETVMPAYSAQLFILERGRAWIHYAHGGIGQSSGIGFTAPLLRAAPMVIEGPLTAIGVSFTPLGWAMISNLPVAQVHDTTLDAGQVLSAEHLARLDIALAELRAGVLDESGVCDAIATVLREIANQSKIVRREDHRAHLRAIESWLAGSFNPPVADLYASSSLSPRQIQRLCKRYFGVPPAQLAKRYRAIRSAMLLAHDDLPGELRDKAIGAYFDQAHLIRDIRRFTGRTPRQLPADQLARVMLDPAGHGRYGDVVRRTLGDA